LAEQPALSQRVLSTNQERGFGYLYFTGTVDASLGAASACFFLHHSGLA
jgi:hypothetical protein